MKSDNNDKKFTGPLFLIGLPRSGTKLLRSLLNGHEMVSITACETGFLPYWSMHWNEFGDLSNFTTFKKFYDSVQRFSYFRYAHKDDWLIKPEDWYHLCKSYDLQGVYEALMKHDAGIPESGNVIWGDKTPQYTNQLALIHHLWPDAKFVHIIRDVRDYSLSMQHAWGKNLLRSAQRWVDDITSARQSSEAFPDRYMELTYESLLELPQETIQKVCSFLDIEYQANMLTLSYPTERLGDAKNSVGVMQNNKHKYMEKMSERERNKIESISSTILNQLNYPCNYKGEVRRVSKMKMHYYKILDGINLITAKLKRGKTTDAFIFIKQYPNDHK